MPPQSFFINPVSLFVQSYKAYGRNAPYFGDLLSPSAGPISLQQFLFLVDWRSRESGYAGSVSFLILFLHPHMVVYILSTLDANVKSPLPLGEFLIPDS